MNPGSLHRRLRANPRRVAAPGCGPSPRTARRAVVAASAVAAVLTLAACATPPVPTYYTLRADPPTAPAATGAVAGYTVAVGPVTLPAVVDRPEWVITSGHEARLLQQRRWVQPLDADIAQALAAQLNHTLGEVAYPESSGTAAGWPIAPRFRVQVDVMEFESRLAPAPAVSDRYRWVVRCLSPARPAPMRTGFRAVEAALPAAAAASAPATAAGTDFPGFVQAHAQGLQDMGDELARALQELSPQCPAP